MVSASPLPGTIVRIVGRRGKTKGYLYSYGLGVARNEAQGRVWLQRAAAGGDAGAQQWLAQHPTTFTNSTSP
jgi:hypothetical protein